MSVAVVRLHLCYNSVVFCSPGRKSSSCHSHQNWWGLSWNQRRCKECLQDQLSEAKGMFSFVISWVCNIIWNTKALLLLSSDVSLVNWDVVFSWTASSLWRTTIQKSTSTVTLTHWSWAPWETSSTWVRVSLNVQTVVLKHSVKKDVSCHTNYLSH